MRHQPDRTFGQRLDTPWLRRQDGVETLEVALIGALIVVIILMAVPLLEPGIIDAFDDVTNAMQNPEAQLE
jgi:Flp pilus assembly pilin Flp